MFTIRWTIAAESTYQQLKSQAAKSLAARQSKSKTKATRDEALFKKVVKCLALLQDNPRHPGLCTHEFTSLSTKECRVFEAYIENNTPGAFRLFWHYGPAEREITILAITAHP